ncbi:hypothetical protein GW17_00052813 [Ensete ventricosum]|nr:hypothetical protein GW17_00052813 [Ensete ventricosum]RZS06903.1 hypothetical protein BHM03_00037620 [Ensete ventricosum]
MKGATYGCDIRSIGCSVYLILQKETLATPKDHDWLRTRGDRRLLAKKQRRRPSNMDQPPKEEREAVKVAREERGIAKGATGRDEVAGGGLDGTK